MAADTFAFCVCAQDELDATVKAKAGDGQGRDAE
jgi:hypothetical protein